MQCLRANERGGDDWVPVSAVALPALHEGVYKVGEMARLLPHCRGSHMRGIQRRRQRLHAVCNVGRVGEHAVLSVMKDNQIQYNQIALPAVFSMMEDSSPTQSGRVDTKSLHHMSDMFFFI